MNALELFERLDGVEIGTYVCLVCLCLYAILCILVRFRRFRFVEEDLPLSVRELNRWQWWLNNKYFLFVFIPRASFYVWTAFCLFGMGLPVADSVRDENMGLPFAFLPVFVYSWFAMFKLSPCDDEFEKAYKLSFVIEELQAAFDDVCYRPLEGIPKSVISETHLPKVGNYLYSSDDYLEATYKGVHFRQSDVMFLSNDSDSGRRHEVCFHGPWMIFSGNKNLVGEVQVVERGFDFAHRDRKRGAVSMEDVRFNDRFDVFAHDAHDAFYVLTPDVIETFLEFADNTKHKFMVGFVNDEIHVALDLGHGIFEAEFGSGSDADAVRQKVRYDIGIITKVIDELVLSADVVGSLESERDDTNG